MVQTIGGYYGQYDPCIFLKKNDPCISRVNDLFVLKNERRFKLYQIKL